MVNQLIKALGQGRARKVAAGIVAAIALAAGTAAGVSAQWPTTCVELNDIVEQHLGNHHNVGIYQRTWGYGPQAEQACRNDHRQDVRNTFGWAVGATPPPSTSVAVAPPPGSSSVSADIAYIEFLQAVDADRLAIDLEFNARWASLADVRDPFEAEGAFLYIAGRYLTLLGKLTDRDPTLRYWQTHHYYFQGISHRFDGALKWSQAAAAFRTGDHDTAARLIQDAATLFEESTRELEHAVTLMQQASAPQ